MLKLQINIVILSLIFLCGQSNASTIVNWTEGDHNIPGVGWMGADILNTYNNVTVTIVRDGLSGEINMYDNSELTMYGGYIGELNIYENATASIYKDNIHYIFADSTSTGWVKLYANIEYIGRPNPDGYISIHGHWLVNDGYFDIALKSGVETIKHIQFIPEPATLLLLGLGAAMARKRKA
jgi:hypothetical protein